MNLDTRFPVWLWVIGWLVTLGIVINNDLLDSYGLFVWLYYSVVSLVIWPLFMGFAIGDIVSFVQ